MQSRPTLANPQLVTGQLCPNGQNKPTVENQQAKAISRNVYPRQSSLQGGESALVYSFGEIT